MIHKTASAHHYDTQASHYDTYNEIRSAEMNAVIENQLAKNSCKTILDVTCGTGSQVFWLQEKGYQVIGSDISKAMIDRARSKSTKSNLSDIFHVADMRSVNLGTHDAVLSIFNAIGHLTVSDFTQALGNIRKNLVDRGIYIFDIFNADYFNSESNITQLTIDWHERLADRTVRKIQYSTLSKENVLASYTIYHEEKVDSEPHIQQHVQTLQIYTKDKLKVLLETNGFELINVIDFSGKPYEQYYTQNMLLIARKK